MNRRQLCNPIGVWRRVLGLRGGWLAGVGLLLVALAGCHAPQPAVYPAGAGTLTVTLEGFRNDRGAAIVSLFAGPAGFPDQVAAALATVTVPIRQGTATAPFPAVPYGEYAVCVLHDEDGDGRMATGLLGVPREGFGFSGQPDYRFGPPRFGAASFLLLGPQRDVTIILRYETARRQHQEEGRAAGERRPQE